MTNYQQDAELFHRQRDNAEKQAKDWHQRYNETARRVMELQEIIEELEAKIDLLESNLRYRMA